MNAAARVAPPDPTSAQVVGFMLPFIERALKDRVRYRYVQPTVLQEGESFRIEAPCCSRNVDPDGGVIPVARLTPAPDGSWSLQRHDHAAGQWRPYAEPMSLGEALDTVCVDAEREVLAMIYLDHHATTPPSQAVIDAMTAVMAGTWANASSKHGPGQAASRVLVGARATVARVLGCKPAEVVFTSGATEANHLAVRGLLAAAPEGRRRVVFSAVEHAGHLKLARELMDAGVPVDFITVRTDGALDFDAATRLIGADVALVSLMAANNETGVLMPVAEVAALAAAAGARLHVDATQWVGKLPFAFSEWRADAVSFSAHKFNGPKGVGALLLRQGVTLRPTVPGSQERGRRGGTENLPAITGLATALDALGSPDELAAEAARLAALRDRLEGALMTELPDVHIWCAGVPRLPGVSFLRVGRWEADVLLQRLERLGFAASSGAACSSSGSAPSHVLTAMGVPDDEALGAVRLSLGRTTTAAEIDALIAALPTLRSLLPAADALAA